MTKTEVDAELVDEIVDQIRPIITRRGREVQGAVCANLLAMWLAGHRIDRGLLPAPAEFRETLLADIIELVRDLVPFEDLVIQGRIDAAMKT